MTTFISLDDPKLCELLGAVPPSNGYLLMADLVGSTSSKRGRALKYWAADFLFPFRNIKENIGQNAFKVVGDMAMYWFPDSDSPDPEYIMSGLIKVQRELGKCLRMAFIRCENVYEVSFHAKVPEDVYGLDVDLTSRLLGFAQAGEIILNAACKTKIVEGMKGFDFSSELQRCKWVDPKDFAGFSIHVWPPC